MTQNLIIPTPDWNPFSIAPQGYHPQEMRSLQSVVGIGDRLRTAAFAERQAGEAFRWAARSFPDASEELRQAWLKLAAEEDKHLHWLLTRMKELGQSIEERTVSDALWFSLVGCSNARDFAFYMATAEQRGKKAGERFRDAMMSIDPITAQIFGQIAYEETSHIALAEKFYGPDPRSAKGPSIFLKNPSKSTQNKAL